MEARTTNSIYRPPATLLWRYCTLVVTITGLGLLLRLAQVCMIIHPTFSFVVFKIIKYLHEVLNVNRQVKLVKYFLLIIYALVTFHTYLYMFYNKENRNQKKKDKKKKKYNYDKCTYKSKCVWHLGQRASVCIPNPCKNADEVCQETLLGSYECKCPLHLKGQHCDIVGTYSYI